MVGVGEHLLQGEARFIESSRLREALDEPERAQAEVALAPFEAVRSCVLRPVTLHERVVGQFLLDTVEGGDPTWVHGADELDQRHHEQGGVEGVRAVILYEAILLGVPALLHDLLVDGVTLGHPAPVPRGQSALAGDPARPLQGHPAEYLGEDELAPSTSDLPNTLVRVPPVLAQPVQDLPEVLPEVVVEGGAVLVVEVGCVEHGPVEVELALLVGAVSEPYRGGVHVSGEMREFHLGYVLAAIYAVERLQEAVYVLVATVAEPAHEVSRLVLETDVDQGVERQRRVPEPGVTVVPVSGAPDPLGQAHRGGGDERARRIVDHELEDEGGTVDYLPPPPLISTVGEPASPVDQGALQQLLEPDVRKNLPWSLAPLEMCQDKCRPLALAEREARTRSAFRPLLQPHVGRQPKTIVPRREDSSCFPDGDRVIAAEVIQGREGPQEKNQPPP